MDPIIAKIVSELIDVAIQVSKDVLLRNSSRWNSVKSDIGIYADECERGIVECVDALQALILDILKNDEMAYLGVKRYLSAWREIMQIPEQNQAVDNEWEKNMLIHVMQVPWMEPAREFMDMLFLRIRAFASAYNQQLLSYCRGQTVNRELLILEKNSVLALLNSAFEAANQLKSHFARSQGWNERSFGSEAVSEIVITEGQGRSISEIERMLPQHFDRLLQRMIDRISLESR